MFYVVRSKQLVREHVEPINQISALSFLPLFIQSIRLTMPCTSFWTIKDTSKGPTVWTSNQYVLLFKLAIKIKKSDYQIKKDSSDGSTTVHSVNFTFNYSIYNYTVNKLYRGPHLQYIIQWEQCSYAKFYLANVFQNTFEENQYACRSELLQYRVSCEL